MSLKRVSGPFGGKKNKKIKVEDVLKNNSNEIKSELMKGDFHDLFDICIDEVVKQIIKNKKDNNEKEIIENAINILKDMSIDLSDNLSNKRHDIINEYLYDKYPMLEDNRQIAETLISEISNMVDDNFNTFINDFIKNEKEQPTLQDFELFVEYVVDVISDNYFEDIDNRGKSEENDEDVVSTETIVENNNDNLFKEYDIEYTIEEYEDMDSALKDLKDMINDYNTNHPSTPINMNIIDNTTHASIKGRIIISRLKKIAANSIWELLKELNFDFEWIQNNQSNGVTATFYEGSLTESGMTYNNIQHFIIYYDGPTIASNSRLKIIAEQLLLEAPEQPLLLPEPNYYYVILNDSFGNTVNTSEKNIEKACVGIKKFSNFIDAEKWILSEKQQIVAREGSSIPNDDNVWKKHEETIYETYYNEVGSVPTNEKTEYSITISLSDTKDAKELYNKWKEKYKSIL